MRRFFVEKIKAEEGRFAIGGTEARHIIRVLRMGPGEHLILLDREGRRFQALIESVRRKDLTVILQAPLPPPPPSPLEMTLGQAVLKSHAMDYVIQKASELGVKTVLPFVSERTVVHPKVSGTENKGRRWQEIAIAASKQSDRFGPMAILPTISFPELVRRPVAENTLKLILWEGEEDRSLKSVVRAHPRPKAISVLVGPEGGFAQHEVLLAGEAGFVSVSLGGRILRAETAAIAMAAIFQYEWGDLGTEETTK